jgi:hypothetical protein
MIVKTTEYSSTPFLLRQEATVLSPDNQIFSQFQIDSNIGSN